MKGETIMVGDMSFNQLVRQLEKRDAEIERLRAEIERLRAKLESTALFSQDAGLSEKERKAKALKLRINCLPLSTHMVRKYKNAFGIETLGELVLVGKARVMELRGEGEGSIKKLTDGMRSLGVEWSDGFKEKI